MTNNIEKQYLKLLKELLDAPEKDSRAGPTTSLFGKQLVHDMSLGFPILTTKKVFFKHGVTELLWILQGRTDLEYLHNHGLKYWDPDYKRSGRTDGTLGPVYGKQLRCFQGHDQLKDVLLAIKKNPSSRRIMASLWNPIDMDDMVLPPCHYGFQVYINDGKMDLMWNQRSADVFLGLPYDIVMYGLLLEMLAVGSGYTPGRLVASLGDCHLYANHREQAKEQIWRTPTELPKLSLKWGLSIVEGAGNFVRMDNHKTIKLEGYNPADAIRAPLSVG